MTLKQKLGLRKDTGTRSGPEGGLSQAQLSRMMLVNRADVTSLINRMEKAGLVLRKPAPSDRRYNIIRVTARSRKLFDTVQPLYTQQVKQIISVLKQGEQIKLTEMLKRIRGHLTGQRLSSAGS